MGLLLTQLSGCVRHRRPPVSRVLLTPQGLGLLRAQGCIGRGQCLLRVIQKQQLDTRGAQVNAKVHGRLSSAALVQPKAHARLFAVIAGRHALDILKTPVEIGHAVETHFQTDVGNEAPAFAQQLARTVDADAVPVLMIEPLSAITIPLAAELKAKATLLMPTDMAGDAVWSYTVVPLALMTLHLNDAPTVSTLTCPDPAVPAIWNETILPVC
jgi:hypothetical protein